MSAESVRRTEQIPAWKEAEVEEIIDLLNAHESVGVVDITGIPSRQLQNMRAGLHGTAVVRVSRNTLLIHALEQVDDGLEQLVDEVDGQVGLIATNENPFGLYRELEASKTPAPINAGETAPNDIVIPAGDTGIDPGPFVGDLQQVGAQARIDEGSIKVTADSVVAETGDTVTDDLAAVLAELEIEPKEVGLDLRAVYADGILFEPDELAIDIDEYRDDVARASTAATNLAVSAAVPTDRTTPLLLRKAADQAIGLGVAATITEPGVVPALVRRADAHVRAIASQIADEEALPEELRGGASPAPADDQEGDDDAVDDDDDDTTATEESDDDEEDDEDAGAAGLGNMFG